MTIIERTKKASKKYGWNLQDTALKAGLGVNAIYKWKNQAPSITNLQKVAKVLNVSTDYLLGNTDEMTPNKKESAYQTDLKEAFDNSSILSFGGKEIPEAELKIIRRILEDMDD